MNRKELQSKIMQAIPWYEPDDDKKEEVLALVKDAIGCYWIDKTSAELSFARHKVIGIFELNPHLSSAEIARQVSISRERVRQILGNRRVTKTCLVCGVSIFAYSRNHPDVPTDDGYYNGYCPAHYEEYRKWRRLLHYAEIVCAYCGQHKLILLSQYKRAIANGRSVFFCSYSCRSKHCWKIRKQERR